MLELLFLLLPIAAAYGWYMGHRSAKKDQENINNKLSRDYVTGVNFCFLIKRIKLLICFLICYKNKKPKMKLKAIHNLRLS